MAPAEHDPREVGTRAILDALLDGDATEPPDLRDLFDGLGRRGFGMLLFVAALPAFIPIPVGGAVSGPLVVLIATQLLVGLRKPWLPAFIAERAPRRQALARFERIVDPWLRRLERLVRPRLPAVLDHRLGTAFTGLLLLLLGLLLALAAIEQCHPRNSNTRQQHNQRQTTQDGQLHQPHTGIGRQALLQGFEFFAQGFTVAHHRTLGLTG